MISVVGDVSPKRMFVSSSVGSNSSIKNANPSFLYPIDMIGLLFCQDSNPIFQSGGEEKRFQKPATGPGLRRCDYLRQKKQRRGSIPGSDNGIPEPTQKDNLDREDGLFFQIRSLPHHYREPIRYLQVKRMDHCDWCSLSEKDRRFQVYESRSWSVFLADEQDHVGRCLHVASAIISEMLEYVTSSCPGASGYASCYVC